MNWAHYYEQPEQDFRIQSDFRTRARWFILLERPPSLVEIVTSLSGLLLVHRNFRWWLCLAVGVTGTAGC